MLGPKQEAQGALFYEFSIEDHVTGNEGWNSNFSVGTLIPGAQIIWQSDEPTDFPGVSAANTGFFAIAYKVDGQVYLSFRGTDDGELEIKVDPDTGWPVGAGQVGSGADNASLADQHAIQAELAIRAYHAVQAAISGTKILLTFDRCAAMAVIAANLKSRERTLSSALGFTLTSKGSRSNGRSSLRRRCLCLDTRTDTATSFSLCSPETHNESSPSL